MKEQKYFNIYSEEIWWSRKIKNLKFESENADIYQILFNKEESKEEIVSYRQSVQTI